MSFPSLQLRLSVSVMIVLNVLELMRQSVFSILQMLSIFFSEDYLLFVFNLDSWATYLEQIKQGVPRTTTVCSVRLFSLRFYASQFPGSSHQRCSIKQAILRNTYFEENLRPAASVNQVLKSSIVSVEFV